jgi:hypothetical protein
MPLTVSVTVIDVGVLRQDVRAVTIVTSAARLVMAAIVPPCDVGGIVAQSSRTMSPD